MKKFIALLMAVMMILTLAACGSEKPAEQPTEAPTQAPTQAPTEAPTQPVDDGVMSHEEYMAAAMDSEVVIEAYVQATQSWWEDKITVYAQDEDGAYFIYEMACAEADAAKLVPGTKIKVTGYKGEWAGEVEIMDGTFEIVEGNWTAQAFDATDLLGTDELIDHQNELAAFKGMVVEAIEYKNGEPGDDIYVTVSKDGAKYDFCVERYLTDPDTDVYKTVGTLAKGDIVDIEGFLYWYEGVNTHITAVTPVGSVNAKSEGVMTYAEYEAAALDTEVVIEAYVQATQSWWDNKITVYAQDGDGAYFLYELQCAEADAAKLVPGTKIKVTGYKGEWAGEVEVMDGTFEFAGDGTYVAVPVDATAWLGTDELVKHQNQLAVFKGMTVEGIEYKNGEPGDDIYVTLTYGDADYSFCVERYLTGPETEVYAAVGALQAGDVVDVTGFVYWYNGVNTHITAVTK